MESFLTSIDIFKTPFTLRVDSKLTFSSSLSKCLSVAYLLASVILMIVYIINFFTNRTYSAISTKKIKDTKLHDNIDMSQNLFVMSFLFINDENFTLIPFNEDYIEQSQVSSSTLTLNDDGTTVYKKSKYEEIKKCSDPSIKNDFDLLVKEINDFEMNSNLYYCFNPKDVVSLGGSFNTGDFEAFYSLDMKLNYIDLLDEENCNELDECEEIFFTDFLKKNSLVMHLTYFTKIIDLDEPNNYRVETRNYTSYTNAANKITTRIELEKNTIKSSSEVLFGYPEDEIDVIFPIDRVDSRYLLDEFLLEIDVSLGFGVSQVETTINKSYQRVEQMLAGLMALTNVLSMVARLINGIFKDTMVNDYLSTKLYTFSSEIRSLNTRFAKESSEERPIQFIKKNKQNPLAPQSMGNIIFRFCYKKKRVLNIKARTYLHHDIDLLTIVRKNLLFEKLLKVFLKRKEIDLINLMEIRKLNYNINADEIIEEAKRDLEVKDADLRVEDTDLGKCIAEALENNN